PPAQPLPPLRGRESRAQLGRERARRSPTLPSVPAQQQRPSRLLPRQASPQPPPLPSPLPRGEREKGSKLRPSRGSSPKRKISTSRGCKAAAPAGGSSAP